MPARSRNPTRQLVGRQAQLSVAAAHLADLDDARGGLLLVSGEPGIGKTRLAEEIVALGRDRGVRAAWSTAWQGEGAPPLWPWVQILRQLAGSDDALDQFAAESPGASPAARFAQSEAVAGVVRGSAADGPVVVVLDDLQWADAASIRVLAHVAQACRDVACLFVGTYRTDELDPEHVAELARVGVTVAVPRLTHEAAAQLLRTAVGEAVASTAAEAIIERSAGNPLFVWEFGQLLAESGRLDVAPAAVPRAVAAVIERRLARLAEDSIALLRAGAVVGKSFPSDLVASLVGEAESRAASGLRAAAGAGVIVLDGDAVTYRFSHDLVRDVVLEGIEPDRRAELHGLAAAALEAHVVLDPSFHAVVADHLERAGPAQAVAAARRWEQAAHAALRVLAYDDAARCFARAGRNAGPDPRRRVELLVEEGDARLLAGELEAARSRFLDAAALAEASGIPDLLARAALGIGAGPVAWEVPIEHAEQIALVTRALDALPADETRWRSMLLARLSVAAATPETMDLARQRADLALDLAEEVGDPVLIAQALAAVNDAFAGPAHTMVRRDNADAIVELAATAGDRMLELLGHRFRIVADLEVGDIAAADRGIAAFARLAGQLRQPLVSWYAPLFGGMRALLRGDLGTADRLCREVAVAAEATSSVNAALMAATLRMGIDVFAGNVLDAGVLDGIVEVDPAEWATYAAGVAFAKWSAGDHDGARDLLHLHSDNGFSRLGDDGEHVTTLLLFGRLAIGLDEAAVAEAVYTLLLPHAELWAVDGIAGCCWGPVDLELGRLALSLDRAGAARAHLARARTMLESVDAPLILADVAALEHRCEPLVDTGPTVEEAGDETGNVFRREGQFWTLAYAGTVVRMKDAKGLQDLARLVAQPGIEIHVLDLAGALAEPERRALGLGGDLGAMLDARARAEYRRRLAELEDDLDDAERCHDLARAGRAREERDFIAAELAAALGLGGKPRRTGEPAERARKAVTGRIRLTIGRIEEENPDLARHLSNAVRTGTYCAYRPENSVGWAL